VLVNDMSTPGRRSPNCVVPMACTCVCTSRASSFRVRDSLSGGFACPTASVCQGGARVVAAPGQLPERGGPRPPQVGIHAVVDAVRGYLGPVPCPDRGGSSSSMPSRGGR
jgi:hypothetical protein